MNLSAFDVGIYYHHSTSICHETIAKDGAPSLRTCLNLTVPKSRCVGIPKDGDRKRIVCQCPFYRYRCVGRCKHRPPLGMRRMRPLSCSQLLLSVHGPPKIRRLSPASVSQQTGVAKGTDPKQMAVRLKLSSSVCD